MKLISVLSLIFVLSACATTPEEDARWYKASGEMLKGTGDAMQKDTPPAAQPNKSTNCTTSVIGNQAYTNCQ